MARRKNNSSMMIVSVLVIVLVAGFFLYKSGTFGKKDAGKVTVYSIFQEEEARKILDQFKKETGIDYDILRLPSGEAVARVQNEMSKPQADFLMGGPADSHEVLKQAGTLKAYTSPNAADIPDNMKDNAGFWTGFYMNPVAIGINEQRWKEKYGTAPYPQSFKDLLDPKFKGEIGMSDPATSGTAYTAVASLAQVWGREEMLKYMGQLLPNLKERPKSGIEPIQKAAKGEYTIGVTFLGDQLKMKAQGNPIVSIVPEAAGYEIGGLSIIKGGPNTEAAKKLMDFMLTKEPGLLYTQSAFAVSVKPSVPVPNGGIDIKTTKYNKNYSLWEAAEQRKMLQDLLKNLK
ncbi:ABC transporter substrate-binding protein [Paenibacillus sp. GD4]|jgi:iron(III) transport system substrate-binding protein|uniref:ABC transporter substrate-binding protein n=1 Tax=Paenibacillus TaxID=44249 RepID=UPI002543BCC7|nr:MULTISPECIES: ABC transporter substrate-binding protein [Paenibacillus]MDQ1911994.1 ABC transporter substrate-binding protein [Paenibacillus sp. GD4]